MTFSRLLAALAIAGFLLTAACQETESGPIKISAIGRPPRILNPNLERIEPPDALLLEATAQGLVRFDATGQIEPALAQSWIASDDGLRYTFRLAPVQWTNGGTVTAQQVVSRLRAAISHASRNGMKPLLGSINEIEAMTDDVLEISLHGPRPNFLQLLAQPDLAIMQGRAGTGPFRIISNSDGVTTLTMHRPDEDEEEEIRSPHAPDIILRGEQAAIAIARFRRGDADLVIGGTLGDLPLLRATDLPEENMRFDPVSGFLGLTFTAPTGIWADPRARDALNRAIDRNTLLAAFDIPDLLPRLSIVPAGMDEHPNPQLPIWSEYPLPMLRQTAANAIAELSGGKRAQVRVALPEGMGYRLLFAFLRRDWQLIGVDAIRVDERSPADLRLMDEVAPAGFSSWYLRYFTCERSVICSPEADRLLNEARLAQTMEEKQAKLAAADQLISNLSVYVPIASPVRWSLVSARLNGFRTNPFGHRFPGSLVNISD